MHLSLSFEQKEAKGTDKGTEKETKSKKEGSRRRMEGRQEVRRKERKREKKKEKKGTNKKDMTMKKKKEGRKEIIKKQKEGRKEEEAERKKKKKENWFPGPQWSVNQIFIISESLSKMAMEAAPTSPQLTNFAPQNTAAVSHTVPASHTTVNLIQPEQAKGLYIVDPSQQHAALQMFGTDQRFMANPVEFNPAGGISTTAASNGNAQITMVSCCVSPRTDSVEDLSSVC